MKKYSLLSIIFIAFIGLWTYITSDSSTTFNIFGMNITLINALWSMIFLFSFYLISMVYFSIVRFKAFNFERSIKKDRENILKNIENGMLDKEKKFVVKELNDINEFVLMIDGLEIKITEDERYPFLADLKRLENKEVVDLKKYKLLKTNKWYIKNLENGILAGDLDKAREALSIDVLKDKAIEVLAKNSPINEILANNYPIYKETILNNLKNDRIAELIEKSNLTNDEYIQIAKILHKDETNPERLLKLFEHKKYPYLYLLIEYEMIDKAIQFAKENEIKFFEYYLMLRQKGEKIPIEEYMNARNF